MKIIKIISLLLFYEINFFICQNIENIHNINNENFSIENAVYIIRNRKGDLNLEIQNNSYPIFLNILKKPLKKNFLIAKENTGIINETTNFFYIIDEDSNNRLSITKENSLNFSSPINNDLSLWNIIPKINSENKLVYYVQNKNNKKFWKYSNDILIIDESTDINNLTMDNEFLFIKLYKESKKIESQILKDEPIDVLIKYIDLSDPNLVRKGIPQIKKDNDNKELKFSVRSIIQNIPWVNKIYILMPNEKVSFFKPAEQIREKIIYVKDKDLLGFDSASSPSFQFNLHKMKKFGISENFILMDDDCFIGKPLKKIDFFYEENGKVYPTLITSDYYEMDKILWEKRLNLYILKSNKIKEKLPHSSTGFEIQHARSLLLMYNIFGDDNKRYGKKLIEPAFTHNAIPVKLSDIEELHNLIVKYYPYSNETLFSLFRNSYSLQMQTTYMAYVKNQYDRKVSKISSAFYDLTHYKYIPKNEKKLFVINTGLLNYKKYLYAYERKNLNNLFPNKTIYELGNDSDIELNEFLDLEKFFLKNVFIEVRKYKKNELININENRKKSVISIDNKIKYENNLLWGLKNNKTKNNYSKILSDEIAYLKNENKKLENINKYLFYFIVVLLTIKIMCYLIVIKRNCIEKNEEVATVI